MLLLRLCCLLGLLDAKRLPLPEGYEVLQVQVLTRHGERTPAHPVPVDGKQAWSAGLGVGELTPRGFVQHVRLGQKLRRRYGASFVPGPPASSRQQIYVRTSDLDRCHLSAQGFLRGFFSHLRRRTRTHQRQQQRQSHSLQDTEAEDFVENDATTSADIKTLLTLPPIHTVPPTMEYLLRG
eukprot:g58738.t1